MNITGSGFVYPGWRVLAGSFVCSAFAIGFTTYIFGMFAIPVTAEFGITRASFNNGMIAFMVGCAVLAPLVGQVLDRFPVRLMFVLGGVSFGGALMLISRADSLSLMLILIGVLVAFGAAACGGLGANTVTVRWFQKRRGRALGILAISTSVGGFIAQPLTALLIGTLGWRHALFVLGLITTFGFVLMAWLTIRDRPLTTEYGYEDEFPPFPDVTGHATGNQERTWKTRELLLNRNFWIMAIGIGLLFAVDQAVLVSQIPYFQDTGFDLPTAALLVSVKTISAIGGKLIVGALADKIDLRLLFAYVAGSNTLLLGIYILQPSLGVLLVAVALLGIAVGGVYPLWTTLIAWLFGARSYGTVMGLMSIVIQVLAIASLRFVGETYDKAGSYLPAFGVFIGFGFAAMTLIAMLRPERPLEREHQASRKEPGRAGA